MFHVLGGLRFKFVRHSVQLYLPYLAPCVVLCTHCTLLYNVRVVRGGSKISVYAIFPSGLSAVLQ